MTYYRTLGPISFTVGDGTVREITEAGILVNLTDAQAAQVVGMIALATAPPENISGAVTYVKPAAGIPVTDLDPLVQIDLGLAVAAYQKPLGGIPPTDLTSGAQASLTAAGTAYQKPNTGIPSSDLASVVQTNLGLAASSYQKPGPGIPSGDLTSAVQANLTAAGTAYQKPGPGIPSSDMAAAVQTNLTAASTAYQKPGGGIPSTDLALAGLDARYQAAVAVIAAGATQAAARAAIDAADTASVTAAQATANTGVTNAAAAQSTANAAAPALNTTAVKTSAYSAAVSDFVPVNATSGGVTVTLPTTPVDKARVAVKKMDSSANVVTIAVGGADVINQAGTTSASLLLQHQAIVFQYSSSQSTWYAVSTDAPLSQLDKRYITTGFAVPSANAPSLDGFVLTPAVVPAANNGDVNGHGRQTVFMGDWTVSVSVTINGSGGTARWAIGGQYADIAPTATYSTVQTALQGLSTVGVGSVTVTGGPGAAGGGTPYIVSYAAKYLAVGGLLPLTVDATSLTGGAHSATLVWTNNWGADTGNLFGEDSYTVTGGGATDGNGVGIMYGALMEANQCGGGTIGTIVALMGEAAFYGSNATGPVDTMISLNAAGPHYKGTAVPASCTATNVYGLKVAGCQGPYVFTDAVITSGSPTITSASSAFDPNILIGKVVTGPGIPAGAYITTLTTTSITLSANCTASSAGSTVTINGTLNSTNAYTAYFGPGAVAINGKTSITPWKDDVPLKLVGLFGGASDLLELWSGPNKMIHFGKFGTVSMANALTTFEGQSPWQMTIGASTIASVSHPGISFGAPYNAAIISPSSGVIAVAAGLQLGVGYASQPAGSRLWSGSGAPSISASVAGDFYFRTDTPSTANQRIYVATAANTWTGIV